MKMTHGFLDGNNGRYSTQNLDLKEEVEEIAMRKKELSCRNVHQVEIGAEVSCGPPANGEPNRPTGPLDVGVTNGAIVLVRMSLS